jgi:predicted RNA binding protein YcfA (HicA-like mRNA interferase family)
MRIETNSRKLIKLMEAEGWRLVNIVGSHHQFQHPERPGKITVPHPKKDLPFGLAQAIHRQAGLLK